MKKTKEYSLSILLGLFLFTLINLPDRATNCFRTAALLCAEPLFVHNVRTCASEELMDLKCENKMLREQIDYVRGWLTNEERIESMLSKIESVTSSGKCSSFMSRRLKEQIDLLKKEINSVKAKVIFREPASWSSGLWVDKGLKANDKSAGNIIVAKNSPVLVGNSLVGIVEVVEENRSYVRLITDARLTPSVRALRGKDQDSALIRQIDDLKDQLALRKKDILSGEELISALTTAEEELVASEQQTKYLAKGELRGSSFPVWRCRSSVLKGFGFNYDFADEEGEAKGIHQKLEKPLLRVGDILVTSGMDGLFPAGLEVATVSKIYPLKEGSYAYNIEAIASCKNMENLTSVTICAPIL